MDHPGGLDRERSNLEFSIKKSYVEFTSKLGDITATIGRRNPLPREFWAIHRHWSGGDLGVVLASHVVGAEIDEMVHVKMADQNGINSMDVRVLLQRPEGPVAEIQQNAVTVMLQQVARRRGIGPRERPRAAHHS